MKIGIDISQIVYKGTGVSRYMEGLVDGLLKYDDMNKYTFFFSSLRQKLSPEWIAKLQNKNSLKSFPLPPSALNIMWNTAHIMPIESFVGNVDIFYTSDWTEPPAKKAKKITTIHDVVTFKFPETSHPKIIETQKKRLEWVKKESEIIVCNSQATKEDVMDVLHIPENKLRVIYPVVYMPSVSDTEMGKIKEQYHINEPFILTVGTLQPRKNIKRLIEAFKNAQLKDVALYIVGMKGWGETVTTHEDTNIKFLGFVPDELLFALYKEAIFFVYPALYEGFGYPVVEAMKMGCPVATSNTSSLRELTDGFGIMFDPNSVDDMAEKMTELYNNGKLRLNIKEKCIVRGKDFTPHKSTQELLAVFKELA